MLQWNGTLPPSSRLPHPHRQTAACGTGLLEKIKLGEPSNRRARGTQRTQDVGCVVAGLPRQGRGGARSSLTLPWRMAEIHRDHGLSCRGVAAESVGLESPLLDGGNRRPAQNKISPDNFQILDATIASNHHL